MATQSFAEMNQSFRDAFTQGGERMMAMNTAWMDWQLSQVKAAEAGTRAAMSTSFAAVEQTLSATAAMNRIVFDAFAPKKAEEARTSA